MIAPHSLTPTGEQAEPDSRPAPSAHRSKRVLIGLLVLIVSVPAAWYVAFEWSLSTGQTLVDSRLDNDAIVWLERARFLNSSDARVEYQLARAYRRTERFEEAAEARRNAEELDWNFRALQREKWIESIQRDNFRPVEKHWDELLTTVDSDFPEICRGYVAWRLSRFELEPAEAALDEWLGRYPNSAEAYRYLAEIAEFRFNFEDAVRHYESAIEQAPDRSDLRKSLAKILIEKKLYRPAGEQLAVAVELSPEDAETNVLLARVQTLLGNEEQARTILTTVTQTESDLVLAWHALGKLELSAGNFEDAHHAMQTAIELKPEDQRIRYDLASAQRRVGLDDEAERNMSVVQEAAAPLMSLEQLSRDLAANPADLPTRFQIAITTWKYKSRSEGANWFHSLLALSPSHRPTHAALAKHYELEGDQEKSQQHARLAGTTTGVLR